MSEALKDNENNQPRRGCMSVEREQGTAGQPRRGCMSAVDIEIEIGSFTRPLATPEEGVSGLTIKEKHTPRTEYAT